MNEIVEKLGLPGKMISASKSGYRERNPKNLVVFNANLITITQEREILMKPVAEKIWYGDIDITLSREDLVDLSNELQKTIMVLYEMDARFENENRPKIDRFVYKVTPTGEESLGSGLEKYYSIKERIESDEQ
jgi:hypothetical protein